jgi:hypothetical protein
MNVCIPPAILKKNQMSFPGQPAPNENEGKAGVVLL